MDINRADFRRSIIAALTVSLQVHARHITDVEGRERINELFAPLEGTAFNAIDVLVPTGFVLGEMVDLLRIHAPHLDPVEVMREVALAYNTNQAKQGY